MYGIAWKDIQGKIPRPVQAFAADEAIRRAECILWLTPDDPKPYEVVVRLLDGGSVLETWSHKFGGGAGLNRACAGFTFIKDQAAQWLSGAPTEQVRPGRSWIIKINPAAG